MLIVSQYNLFKASLVERSFAATSAETYKNKKRVRRQKLFSVIDSLRIKLRYHCFLVLLFLYLVLWSLSVFLISSFCGFILVFCLNSLLLQYFVYFFFHFNMHSLITGLVSSVITEFSTAWYCVGFVSIVNKTYLVTSHCFQIVCKRCQR